MASRPKRRLPLGRSPRRLGYERRLHVLLFVLGLPMFALAGLLLWHSQAGPLIWAVTLGLVAAGWATVQVAVADRLLRPLQTLSNVVAALRESDYSFRARGARRGDALGDLALEINALANDLQRERIGSLESAALVRRVLAVMEAPVLAFDRNSVLRILNPAAARLLQINSQQGATGQRADTLGVDPLFRAGDEQVVSLHGKQWIVRRSEFREMGVPHTLFLLADVSTALREEERQAWQRLIRVMGHEINNSLTPIKSLAGSLRQMLREGNSTAEFDRPLAIIEARADSLNRFLAAYRSLAQLPPPRRERFAVRPFLEQLASLEARVPVALLPGEPIEIDADKDQLAQAIINLLRNAADAALENAAAAPQVAISCSFSGTHAVLSVRDSGSGIANPSNLFVPFYTTKQHGAGIGLLLVRQIADAHGGAITLGNAESGGAVAELRIPY